MGCRMSPVEPALRLAAAYGRLEGRGRDTLDRLLGQLVRTDRAFHAFRTLTAPTGPRRSPRGRSPRRGPR